MHAHLARTLRINVHINPHIRYFVFRNERMNTLVDTRVLPATMTA